MQFLCRQGTIPSRTIYLRLLAFQFVVISVYGDSIKYTDYCRSVNNELGKCVTLHQCPLFFEWIYERPIVKQKIKLVVKYTCFFDINDPKVCCPLRQIDPEGRVIKSKTSFGDSSVRQESSNRDESQKPPVDLDQTIISNTTTSTTSLPDLIFPKDDEDYESKRKSKAKFVYYSNKLTFQSVQK